MNKDAKQRCITASCIIYKKGKVVLVHHKKLGIWIYPGGHVDPNEHPHDAAVREALEETGLKVKLVSCGSVKIKTNDAVSLPMPLTIMQEYVPYKTGPHLHFDLIYYAKPISGKLRLAKDEATSIGWFSKKDIEKLDTLDNIKQVLLAFFEKCKLAENVI